jgi:hypothetical protein
MYGRRRADRWRTGEVSVFLEFAFGFRNLLLLGLIIPPLFKNLELFSLDIFRFLLYFGAEVFYATDAACNPVGTWVHSSPFVGIQPRIQHDFSLQE